MNYDVVDIEKVDGICSLTFVVDEFSGLFLHQSTSSRKHLRFQLNSNILVSSVGIIALQKSLFSHYFL